MTQPQTASTRTWLTIALVFAALWVAYLARFGPRPPSTSLEASGRGEEASYDWTLYDSNDRPVRFTRFAGKPVFLNVWATWCPPCVAEMPSIARLAEDPRLAGKGIAFVCVSVDEETRTVRDFLAGKSWKMEFYRAEKFPRVFGSEAIPATFIIAPDGRIAASQVGASEWDNPEAVALLEKLAAKAPRAASR